MSKHACDTCGMTHDPQPPNPLPCGCGVKAIVGLNVEGTRTEYHHSHVSYCPLHAAAPDLADALEEIANHLYDKQDRARARELAREALRKAGRA